MRRPIQMLVSAAVVLTGSACPAVQAQTATAIKIDDFRVVGIQPITPPDPRNPNGYIDSYENAYKEVRIIFTTSTDLAALSRQQGQDIRIFYYPCAQIWAEGGDFYERDQQVYDSYGAITQSRAVEAKPELEKFRGLYFFFMPTASRYRTSDYPPSFSGWDFYAQVSGRDMCFLLPPVSKAFSSNVVTIPLSELKRVLSERPIKR